MARKSRKQAGSDNSDHSLANEGPPAVNPYEVLGVKRTATQDEVKSAYRRQALKHHPDKATEADKASAHTKFQEIALAYAVLSDDRRRKRYDITGRTDESLVVDGEDGDFDWATFYREQYEDAISAEKIEAFAKEYRNSDEEAQDVLKAYRLLKGDMALLYEHVMLSDPEQDDARFRTIIDAAVKVGDIEAFPKYTRETGKARKRRINTAKKTANKEAAGAEELAEELGLKNKKQKKGKDNSDLGDLAALIQQRQKGRGAFFDDLVSKYGPGSKKRSLDEPSEEAFVANRKKKSKIGELLAS